ncbi:response regulator [Vibrio sp. JPW-9-11-11]|uniref:hybrid sensor histidine kinase/response regulator n=1 Tax=Vibrio sp. JPW-9-11-11 TaxID=1416532 RepID=UPI0015943FC8|nr:response regulator [Vibrio sp. JPW-9-11-11]NVD06430.1 response regulator [Vibrio sp. JPW-9-11-11]
MLDSLTSVDLHPVFVLLMLVSFVVLQWNLYFIKSIKRSPRSRLKHIKAPYLLYCMSILGWVLSNAYFFSPLLVTWGNDAAIFAAIVANLFSYSAFANAYIVCLMLAKGKRRSTKLKLGVLALVSLAVVLANLFNYEMINSINIEKAGVFALQFGGSTTYFFAIVLCLILLSFECVAQYSRSAKPLQHIKSLYMLFGMSIFMVSTLLIHVVIPMIYDDFSLAWLPPALSISEMMLMGYALVTSRFYSNRHIVFRLLSTTLSVLVIALPIFVVLTVTETEQLLFTTLVTTICTGLFWRGLNRYSEQVASRLVFGESLPPQQKIYRLAEDFQSSIDEPLRKVANILNVDQDAIQLISNVQDEPLYTKHLKNRTSVLVLEEIEESLPQIQNRKEILSLRKLYQKMDNDNVAMVLPIFDRSNNVSHLLIAHRKHNGRLFFGEEIKALQLVVKKAQGYINAGLKIKQSQALANSIAHEMRNPLAQAQLEFEYINQLIEPQGRHAALADHVEKGKQAVERGKQLIDIILREVNDASLALEPAEPTAITPVIRATVEQYGFEQANHRQRVSLQLDEDFVVAINDTLFSFVLFNLLRNAIYYFDSYPNSRIEIRTQKGRYENYLIVRDSGPGIPPNLINRVFDDFFSHNKSGGSGLGLGYCQRVMNAFGGTISCESEPNCYTEFTLSFPATNMTLEQVVTINPTTDVGTKLQTTEVPTKASAPEPNPNRASVPMILVVDDKEIQRALVKLYLEQLGYGVVLANNGKVAIEIIQNNPIDLVFMDIQMPVMDGFEAASIIKQHYPTIPIVALSGESGIKDIQRMSELMDGRLTKPTTKDALSAMLDSIFAAQPQ